MKKLFVLLFFLMLVSFAFSLSVSVPKGNYSKGEYLDINGSASGAVDFVFTSLQGNKNVLNAVKESDGNKEFSFRHFISCTDPSGDWIINIKDEYEEEQQIRIYVNSSVQCEFLRVDFISPSSSSYFRTQKFDVRVKLTDAGKEVNNAEVYFWDFFGDKKRMYFESNGIYYFEGVEIPVDAEIKKWDLMVVSVSGDKEKNGGSNIVSFDVTKVPIDLKLINPAIKEFTFGKILLLKVKPVYPDSSPAQEVKVWVEYNGMKFDLEDDSLGNYFIDIPTEDLNAEIFYLNVFAEDIYGNSGNLSLNLEPKGQLYFYIAQNAIVYIFPIIFIVYVLFVSFKEGNVFVKRLLLKRKKKKLLILMKKMQDDYFNRQIISREIYLKQFDDYNRELDQLENRLTELQKKQELS